MPEIFMPRPPGLIAVEGERFVIVGANGAGKSQLGAWLESQGRGKRESHRISAQRALQMKEFIEPLSRERADRRLYYGTDEVGASPGHRHSNRWRDDPVGHLLNDFDALLASLLSHESERDAKYVKQMRSNPGGESLPVPDSRLDKLRTIWQQLMPHRDVRFDGGKVMASMVNKPAQQYHGSKMSDGERVAIYLIGQALCAPDNALLIIDEPEIHLHRAIREKLWDSIESARRDCLFVFITHDLEFAASRDSATILWIKSFKGGSHFEAWEWEECPKDIDLPKALVLQVLGSRAPVVFVEGDGVTSLDAKLYTLLFPNHRIIPVGGAANVDRCVSALRTITSLHHMKPHGIVDRDRRQSEEIDALADRGITCCPYAEVENLLVEERVVVAVAKRANVTDASLTVSRIKQGIISKLKEQRERQGAQWGEAIVARKLAGFSCKETDSAKVAAAVENHMKGIDVVRTYEEVQHMIDHALSSADYDRVLRVFNQKGLLAVASSFLSMSVETYERMALGAIRDEEHLRHHLAALVPLNA